MNEGIIKWSNSDEEEPDNDETIEPSPISRPVAMCYTEDLRQLGYAKGFGQEHIAALNK